MSRAIGRTHGRIPRRADGRSGTTTRITRTWTIPQLSACCCIGMAIPRTSGSIARARAWVVGMQSRNGGWGAFDADNDHDYLNHIPFADHGALLDPPNGGCHGPLHIVPGATRSSGGRAGYRPWYCVSPARAGARGKLVRAMGDELHLRHMVRALRLQCRRHSP